MKVSRLIKKLQRKVDWNLMFLGLIIFITFFIAERGLNYTSAIDACTQYEHADNTTTYYCNQLVNNMTYSFQFFMLGRRG